MAGTVDLVQRCHLGIDMCANVPLFNPASQVLSTRATGLVALPEG